MKYLVLLILSFSFSAYASFPELFGPSAGSIAIGSLPEVNSAANNYQAAALLGYSQRTQFSFNTFYVNTNFKDINNVVIKNETNTVNTFKKGDVDVNSTPTHLFGAHLSTPLFAAEGPKFNLSIMAPYDRLMEADTGDPYQPSYVMYSNRYLRPSIHLSLAQAFSNWSFSLGAMTGFQSNGETYAVTRTTSGNPSVTKVSFNAKPSLGATASVAYKTQKHTTYMSFQQQMKSKLINRATGETEIASSSSFPFDFDLETLLFYDPMTLRLGHQIQGTTQNLHLGLEFQQWDQYETPMIKMKKRGGTINGSTNYEHLKLKNIFIPRIGFEQKLGEKYTGKLGYFYRPTPIDTSNLKNSGNSIDTDKHVASIGLARLLKIYEKDVNLDFSYQAHFLKSKRITKTPNREDGDTSEPKIGSPGYNIGGMIHVVSLGLSWMY